MMPLPSRILTRSRPDALGVVAVVRDQHALDVVRMVDDLGVGLAARRVHAIDVAVAANSSVMRSRESSVEPMSNCSSDSGGWRCAGSVAVMRAPENGRNLTYLFAAITETARRAQRHAQLQPSPIHSSNAQHDGTWPGRRPAQHHLPAGDALQPPHDRGPAASVSHLPCRSGSASFVSGGGSAAWCGSRARSISMPRSPRHRRSCRATGTSISSSAASFWSSRRARGAQGRLAHQPFGGRRDRRDDGAAFRRPCDPRLLHVTPARGPCGTITRRW